MKEIEAKILEVDVMALQQRLLQLGATLSFDDEMHALYYDDPAGKLSAAQTTLRLRREGPAAVLAVKRKDSNAPTGIKIADEVETHVSDFEQARILLEMLDYQVTLEMRKRRQQYELLSAHIVIDSYMAPHSHIPPFLEIEAQDVSTLHAVAAQLGYGPADLVSLNSAELLVHYARG